MRTSALLLGAGVAGLLAACPAAPPPPKVTPKPPVETNVDTKPTPKAKETLKMSPDVDKRLSKFSPTEITFDDKLAPAEYRVVLKKLVEAAQILDQLYLEQVDPENPAMRERLVAEKAPQAVLDYFDVMYGPWDRLEGDEPFVGDKKKPQGAGFYSVDVTKEELEAFIKAHPEQEKAFRGYFTVIRRDKDGLKAIPYSEFYGEKLTKAAALLKEAAAASPHPALKKYLETRAAAFLSNDYYESDMAWMDLGDSPIEVVIGPYEVYEDKMMGYKAAFEAFITLRDPDYSKRLQIVARYQKQLEGNLPLPKKYHTKRGTSSPISVVVVAFTAGDTRAGVQTAAFNLPNDERVRTAKGSKKVLLKNHSEAKFHKALIPIAKRVVSATDLANITFDAYFTDILLHEMAHGIGPGKIVVNGKKTSVNREMKEIYPAIEECKADIVGLINAEYLVKKKALPKSMHHQIPATYLAGVFRAVRFGAEEAHAQGVLLAFNYLLDKGAMLYDAKSKRFAVNYKTFYKGVRELARELLLAQAKGSYKDAKAMLDKYAVVRPEMKAALEGLTDVPVDIRPTYTILEKMKKW